MQGSMIRARRGRNATGPPLVAITILIMNRTVGAPIHILAKEDVMCARLLILYIMLILRQ